MVAEEGAPKMAGRNQPRALALPRRPMSHAMLPYLLSCSYAVARVSESSPCGGPPESGKARRLILRLRSDARWAWAPTQDMRVLYRAGRGRACDWG